VTFTVAVAPLAAVAVAPVPETVTGEPKFTPSITNCTEPTGVAVLAPAPAVFVTVAAKVTESPKVEGFFEELTEVEVGAGVTVCPPASDP
jgi:hypothetical protein